MVNKLTTQIITANDLLSGEVVYLSSNGTWAIRHSDAITFETSDEASTRLASVLRSETSVVGPYLAFANVAKGCLLEPTHFREMFRTKGPSNRFLGKQTTAA